MAINDCIGWEELVAPIRTTAGPVDVEDAEEVEDAGAEVVIVEEEKDDKEKLSRLGLS